MASTPPTTAVSSTAPVSPLMSFSPPKRTANEGAICIVLAAGFSQLERDLDKAGGDHAGLPKALLPVAGKPMLDHWWEYLSQNRAISEAFIISNALKYKHFERWATAKGMPMSRVVNTGATAAQKSRGVLRDVELGIKRAQQVLGDLNGRDVIIFAGDTLFFKDFDLDRILNYRAFKKCSLMLYYSRKETDSGTPSQRGMCEVDTQTGKVTAFAEKPSPGARGYDFSCVSPLFYILEPAAWQQIAPFNANILETSSGAPASAFSFGRFVEHAVENLHLPFVGMRMPGAFFLIGAAAGLEEYQRMDACFGGLSGASRISEKSVKTMAYARVGLIGNPSDGFHGKTIAVTVRNFWASVELRESERLTLLPHPLYDPSSFSGLSDLHFIGRREGYYGGTRLLMATCKRFQELCTTSGIALPRKNFTASYDTNIPRQVGLAGSSAIVTSLFRALMQFYDLTDEHIPLEQQPSFVLSVESELGIQAGLQDRVVQAYGGLVFMDFDAEYMTKHGHGRYERLSNETFMWLASLPLFIAYEADPSDSGKIHSNVRARWDAKDPVVMQAMSKFAELTVRAKEAMERRDHAALCDLMDENFATRRGLYGDECLGRQNINMIEICQKHGAAAKFPGSGGAVLGLCRPSSEEHTLGAFIGADGQVVDEESSRSHSKDMSKQAKLAALRSRQMDIVREALEEENFVFCPLDPVSPDNVDD